jgi:hypothetical protein
MIHGTFCTHCKHYLGTNPKAICVAFPDGIPREILFSEVSHKVPFDGDNGIQYERASETQMTQRLKEVQAKRKRRVLDNVA